MFCRLVEPRAAPGADTDVFVGMPSVPSVHKCAQCAQCTQLCTQCSAEDSNIMIGDHGGFSLFSSGNGSSMQEHVKLKSEVFFYQFFITMVCGIFNLRNIEH